MSSLATLTIAAVALLGAAERGNTSSGKKVKATGSSYGKVIADGRGEAFYLFTKERGKKSRCYGACARAWPPLFTRGRPRGGRGVRKRLLGTVRRRGGALQVTYAGKPLYTYAHEGPGQVLCHNVRLNGGWWWVMGPRGKRRP
jgi:predicted lipoprotein with Yx(FWY)xxD motif